MKERRVSSVCCACAAVKPRGKSVSSWASLWLSSFSFHSCAAVVGFRPLAYSTVATARAQPDTQLHTHSLEDDFEKFQPQNLRYPFDITLTAGRRCRWRKPTGFNNARNVSALLERYQTTRMPKMSMSSDELFVDVAASQAPVLQQYKAWSCQICMPANVCQRAWHVMDSRTKELFPLRHISASASL